jgi:shikimate kinase
VIAPGQTIDGLYAERRPLYRAYADASVSTDGLTPEEVVCEIISELSRLGDPTAPPVQ